MEIDQDPSFKQKIKSSICFSCCFRSESTEPDDQPRLIRSSSSWLRSKASELPEIKDKFHGFISRISKRRTHSGDFRYDPLSYALNFDEGPEDYEDDEFLARNFSSRLAPARPATAMEVRVSREINCN